MCRSTSLLLGASILVLMLISAPAARAEVVYGVRGFDNLVTFDTDSPGTILSDDQFTGLPGDTLALARIDFRPATGGLYGLSVTNSPYYYRFHQIDPATAAVTQIGGSTAGGFVQAAFDFDPTTDRARYMDIAGRNLAFDPLTGASTTLTPLTPSITADVSGLAFDRNFQGTTATTAYGINGDEQLVRIGGVDGNPSADGGQVTPIGPLGGGIGNIEEANLDIKADGTAYAVIKSSSTPFGSHLYSVNLATGAATDKGQIGTGIELFGFAVPPGPAPPVVPPGPTPPIAPPGGAAGDGTPPKLKLSIPKLKLARVLSQKGFTAALTSDEPCTATASLLTPGKSSARSSATFGKGAINLKKVGTESLKVKLTKSGNDSLKKMRRSKSQKKKRLTLSVTAKDPSGNKATISGTATVRR